MKMRNVPPISEVNAIHFPFGDQSGSEGVGAPGVGMGVAPLPLAEILNRLGLPPRSRDV